MSEPVTCVLVALGVLSLSACRTEIVDIRAEDSSVLSTDARLSWRLSGDDGPEESDEPRISLDLDVSYGAGEDALELGPTQGVVVDGQLFTGSDIHAHFELMRVLLDGRIASSPRDRFSIEGFFGVEYSEMNYTVRQGDAVTNQSASSGLDSFGPALGAALIWQPLGWLRCSSEGRASYGFASDPTGVGQFSFDIGVGLSPWDGVGAYFGWRKLSYAANRDADYSSDVKVDLAGPVIALRIGF